VDKKDGSERLPKRLRLCRREEFDLVFKKGKRVRLPGLTIIYLKNGRNFSRFGVSASKRLLPKAVHRNRAKRIVRELFRRNRPIFGEGYDFVFVPVENFLDHPYSQYREWIRKALRK